MFKLGEHYADAVSPEAAERIAVALNAADELSEWAAKIADVN